MNAPAKREGNPLDHAKRDLWGNAPRYGALLRADEDERNRFMAEVFQAIQVNPKLLNCNRLSLLTAVGEAAAMGLSVNPNLGEAYLIPRGNQVNFQRGYKGLVKLAYRSGLIDSIYCDVVYRNEHYIHTGGTDPKIDHVPDADGQHRTGDPEDVVAAYAVVWLKGSTRPVFRTVTKRQIIRAAEASGSSKNKSWSNVWRDHFEAMARKTALIRIWSQLPRDDKLRALHISAERDLALEAGKDVAPMPGIADQMVVQPDPNAIEAPSDIDAMIDAAEAGESDD